MLSGDGWLIIPAECLVEAGRLGLRQDHPGARLADAGQHRQRLLEEADVEHWQLQVDVACTPRAAISQIYRALHPRRALQFRSVSFVPIAACNTQ